MSRNEFHPSSYQGSHSIANTTARLGVGIEAKPDFQESLILTCLWALMGSLPWKHRCTCTSKALLLHRHENKLQTLNLLLPPLTSGSTIVWLFLPGFGSYLLPALDWPQVNHGAVSLLGILPSPFLNSKALVFTVQTWVKQRSCCRDYRNVLWRAVPACAWGPLPGTD